MVLVARWLYLACVFATGCSLALSGPDPQRPKNKAPECDTGKGLVTIDGLVAGTLGITAAALAGSSSSGTQSAALVPALFGAVFVASALRGNGVVNDCREAMADYTGDEPRPPIDAPRPQLASIKVKKPTPPTVPSPAAPPPPPPPASAPPPPPPPAQPAAASADAWSEFWKEVP
jgi:hypothetical protein